MALKNITTLSDVIQWLRHDVEWVDIASQDMAGQAIEVLEKQYAANAIVSVKPVEMYTCPACGDPVRRNPRWNLLTGDGPLDLMRYSVVCDECHHATRPGDSFSEDPFGWLHMADDAVVRRPDEWGVWCLEDERFCDKTIGTKEHANRILPEWVSGKAPNLKPDHGFHYVVVPVKRTAAGPIPRVKS